jgi:hypothetical protein
MNSQSEWFRVDLFLAFPREVSPKRQRTSYEGLAFIALCLSLPPGQVWRSREEQLRTFPVKV